jgi:hypothetical protein
MSAASENSGLETLKNSVLPKLAGINKKVDDMRNSVQADPEDVTDKIIKLAVPAVAGLVLTKILQIAWKKATKADVVPSGSDTATSLLGAMAFASISGALAALMSRVSTKGALKVVDRRQAKRAAK